MMHTTYVLKMESRLDDGKLTYRILKPSGRRHGPIFESEQEMKEYLELHHVVHDHMPMEWISFEDELPGEGEPVLIFVKNGDRKWKLSPIVSVSPDKMIGFLEEGLFTILDVDNFCDGPLSASIEEFSHWCALPEDPV